MQRTVAQRGLGCSESALRKQHRSQRQQLCRRHASVVVRAGPGSGDDEVARLLAETNKLVSGLEASTTPTSEAPEVPEGMELYCDVSGCSIVPVGSSVSMGPTGSMVASVDQGDEFGDVGLVDFVMQEGDGWKLGVDRAEVNPSKYCAAIGSNSFTAALTLAEYDDFVKTLLDLQRSVQTMQSNGAWTSSGDEATLEMSTERVWLQGRAPNQQLQALQAAWSKGDTSATSAFSLRFIFTGMGVNREVSGIWSATAVAEALRAIDGNASPAAAPASAEAVSVSQ